MTDAELYTLIQSDPDALAAYTAGNDDACAARCTDIAPIIRQPVSAAVLRVALARQGNLAGILRMAANVDSPEPPYGTCLTLKTLLDSGDPINIDDTAVQGAAATLVQHGLMDVEDATAIDALGDTRQTITQQQVGAAREWHRVTGVANGVT